MKHFKNILVIADGSPAQGRALQRAAQLADAGNAKLSIMDVVGTVPLGIETLKDIKKDIRDFSFERLQDEMVEARVGKIRSLLSQMIPEYKEAPIKVGTGRALVEIIREVVRGGYDLLIKGVEAKRLAVFKIFGSTDINLMRKCPRPVLLVKNAPNPRYSKILAAVDPAPDEEINALNHKILDLTISLGLLEQGELHIVSAWAMVGEDYFRSGEIKVPKAAIDKMEKEAHHAAERALDELLKKYDLSKLNAKVHLLKGPASQVIAQLAAEEQVELMVMGTVGRSGIDGVLIGNTAEQVLSKVYCSVLALKPDGFITPITCDT